MRAVLQLIIILDQCIQCAAVFMKLERQRRRTKYWQSDKWFGGRHGNRARPVVHDRRCCWWGTRRFIALVRFSY